MDLLLYLLAVAVICSTKGFWDANGHKAARPWDLYHLVARAGLAVACLWGLWLHPPAWGAIPAALVGWAAFRLGSGRKWPSTWTTLLRWLFTRKSRGRLP